MYASYGILEQSSSFGAENIFRDAGFPLLALCKSKEEKKNLKRYFPTTAIMSCEMQNTSRVS